MTLADRYELIHDAPPVDAYVALRTDAGLSPKTVEQGAAAIAGTWFFCHIRERSTAQVVAMGRVIGDGGWYFHIAQIQDTAPADPYITLLADPPGRRLYEQIGFVETAPTVGMRLR